MKKNNKGFTLIELLAIIVILAIIAVITVPIILNIIENSRKGASIDSAYNYKDAINKYYLEELSKNTSYQFPNGVYDVQNDGTLKKGTDTLNIAISGKSPSNGWVKAKNGEITSYSIVIGEYTVTMSNNEVTAIKNGEIAEKPLFKRVSGTGDLAVGEEVYFGTEHFNVISTNENETVLLAKWNLLVGINFDKGTYTPITEDTEGYGWQNENATGRTSTNNSTGVFPAEIAFSGTNYWTSGTNYGHDSNLKSEYAKDLGGNNASYSGNPFPYVYDSNSNLYTHVNNYKKNLESIGADISAARLLTYEEATSTSIGCTPSSNSCPSWIINTSFWLGSAYNNNYVWALYAPNAYVLGDAYAPGISYGARPVIVIRTSDIQ